MCEDSPIHSLHPPVFCHIKASELTVGRDGKAALAAEPQPLQYGIILLDSSVNRGNRKPNEMRYLASWNSVWKLHFHEHLVMLPPTHKCQMQDPPCPFGRDLPLLLQYFIQGGI